MPSPITVIILFVQSTPSTNSFAVDWALAPALVTSIIAAAAIAVRIFGTFISITPFLEKIYHAFVRSALAPEKKWS